MVGKLSISACATSPAKDLKQRIPLDMVFVVVLFGLRRAIRTENSGGCALCGRPFCAPAINSNREFWRMCSVWSSLSRTGGLFGQRIPLDVLCVVVPFGLRRIIRTENSARYGVCVEQTISQAFVRGCDPPDPYLITACIGGKYHV